MFTEASMYDERGIISPLFSRNTVPRLLKNLCALDQHLPALTYYSQGERQYSLCYGQFLGQILHLRNILLETFRVQPGERIGTLCWNCPEVVICNIAALSIGATLVPLNPEESSSAIQYIVQHSGLRLLMHNTTLSEKVLALSLKERDIHTQAIEDLSCPSKAPFSAVDAQSWADAISHMAPAVLLYTSGTTGRPKGVTLSHYNLLMNAEALTRVHKLHANRTHMCVLPLFHANAFGFSLLASYYAGIHLVLNDGLPLFDFWQILRQEKVNICSVVPEILKTLCQRAAGQETLSDLRYLVSAAAPLSVETVRTFYEKTAIPVHQGYGLSESTNFATTLPYEITQEQYIEVMHNQPTPSIGTALYGSEVAIINAQGEKVGPDTPGEIVIQGHSNMSGYWKDRDATEETLGSGYLRTGDQGYYRAYESGNYFFITGRLKEIILRNGQNISPLEIERELTCLAEIGDFAVVGFPHQQVGEEIGLYIYRSQAFLNLSERFNSIAEVPFFKRPKVIVVGNIPVPRTNTGKIRRNSLRHYFSAYSTRIFSTDPVIIMQGEKDARDS